MRTKELLRAIRQETEYQQSALELAREAARLMVRASKRRTKCLVELGAEALKAELNNIHDKRLETSIRDKRAELYILKSELRAAGLAREERRRKPDVLKSPPRPNPTATERSPILGTNGSIIRFKSMPPEGIRKRLKDLKFFYESGTMEWSGPADIAVVRLAVQEEGVAHLVKYLRKR